MSKKPKLYVKSVTKGRSKKAPIGQFDQELNELLDIAFGEALSKTIVFSKVQAELQLKKLLLNMYVLGIKQQIREWIGVSSRFGQPQFMTVNTSGGIDGAESAETNLAQQSLQRKITGFKNFKALNMGRAKRLRWEALSKATIRNKFVSKRKGGKRDYNAARRMMIEHGNLRSTLLKGIREYVKKTGVIDIKLGSVRDERGRFRKIKRGEKISLGNVTIRLLPNVSPDKLPGLAAGDWTMDNGSVNFERMLGFDTETLRKLGNGVLSGSRGADRPKRPMLQPIFTFYTLYHAPEIIRANLGSFINLRGQR